MNMASKVHEQMSSNWPNKLRELKTNDVLLIRNDEHPVHKVMALVSNMNYRCKGDAVYKMISDDNGDSLVTCVFRRRGADLKPRRSGVPVGYVYGPRAAPGTAAPPAVAPPAAAAPSEALDKPPRKNTMQNQPAVAIVECKLLSNRYQSHRVGDNAELEALLTRCRANPQVTEIEIFRSAERMAKTVQWAAES